MSGIASLFVIFLLSYLAARLPLLAAARQSARSVHGHVAGINALPVPGGKIRVWRPRPGTRPDLPSFIYLYENGQFRFSGTEVSLRLHYVIQQQATALAATGNEFGESAKRLLAGRAAYWKDESVVFKPWTWGSGCWMVEEWLDPLEVLALADVR